MQRIVRLIVRLLPVAALCACANNGVGPQSCAAPCMEVTVRLATLHAHEVIPLQANGVTAEAVLDTGAATTTLTDAAATSLGAHTFRVADDDHNMAGTLIATGVDGATHGRLVTIDNVRLAGGLLRQADVMELPSLRFGADLAGLVGGDLLENWDLDLDVGAGRLVLDRPQPGPALVAPWHHATTRVPMVGDHDTTIRIDVVLDGHPVRAIVDTGAPRSLVSTATLAGREVVAADRAVVVRGIADRRVHAQVHHFADLSIGGLSFGALDAEVAPIDMGDADMLIGLDVLRMTRVYVAYEARAVLIDEGAP
jgi:predicted aspartyl protease